MSHGLSGQALAALIPRIAGRRILVLGDPVLDAYLYGTTHRISREAPVLIVREDAREHRLGGAANTAANLAALGANTAMVGPVGNDEEGTRLLALAESLSIDVSRMSRLTRGCTVTKTRVLGGGLNTTKQQMLRIDRENDHQLSAEDSRLIFDRGESAIQEADAIIISDYGSGALTPTYVALARHARALGKIVVVDSRYALSSYKGVTAITPNEPEAEAALGRIIRTPEDAARAALEMRDDLDLQAMLLTRGREGMAIAERGRDVVLIPTHGGHEAVDVTGAGDTVVATFTASLAAGGSVLESAVLANCAASIVVRAVGAATCSPAELTATLEGLES